MRVFIMLLAGAAGLAAQDTTAEAAAKLKQFEKNLATAMRPAGMPVSLQAPAARSRLCSIPLLKATPDRSFKSNMPMIAPDPKVKFSIREVIPPAPTCDEPEKK